MHAKSDGDPNHLPRQHQARNAPVNSKKWMRWGNRCHVGPCQALDLPAKTFCNQNPPPTSQARGAAMPTHSTHAPKLEGRAKTCVNGSLDGMVVHSSWVNTYTHTLNIYFYSFCGTRATIFAVGAVAATISRLAPTDLQWGGTCCKQA